MKCKFIKKGLCVLLAATMLLSLCACEQEEEVVVIEPMEIEEVPSYYFDFLGGKDVMPISGYYGPFDSAYGVNGQAFPEQVTEETFQKIADCGVNMFHHTWTNYGNAPQQVEKMMKYGEKYGVGVTVNDGTINYNLDDDTLSVKELDERINLYRDFPAFIGVYVVDEPCSPEYMAAVGEDRYIGRYQKLINNLSELDVYGAVNLLGCSQDWDGLELYLTDYCENYDVQVLSYDAYAFDGSEGKEAEEWRQIFFRNLSVYTRYAKKYNLPLWGYIQAGGQWNDTGSKFDSDDYYPTEGQFKWNVNVYLATGVKGIEYFPMIQPHQFAFAYSTEYDFQRNGLLGTALNKTQWWYYAKDMNAQIAAADAVLMNSVNKGVIVTGEDAKRDNKWNEHVLEGTSWRELKDVKGNAYIGCFNYLGKTALYVVNYETEYAQKITLELHDAYNMTITHNAEESHVNAKNLELDLKAGEGALIVFD